MRNTNPKSKTSTLKTLGLICLGTISLSLASIASDGGASTGGGTSIVDENGQNQLIDLLEEHTDPMQGLVKFDPRNEPAFKNELMDRLEKIEKRLPHNKLLILSKINEVVDKSEFYFSDKPLVMSNDTCLMVQLPHVSAAAVQRGGKVLIYRGWYESKKTDDKNRAALLIHEIVMLQNKQPACSNVVRTAVRAVINQDRRTDSEIIEQFLHSGLDIKYEYRFDEKNLKPKILALLMPVMKEYCAHNFDDYTSFKAYQSHQPVLTKLANTIKNEVKPLLKDSGDRSAFVLLDRLAGSIWFLGNFNFEHEIGFAYNKGNCSNLSVTQCNERMNSLRLEGQSIAKQECALFQKWATSNRSFVDLATEIRSPTLTEIPFDPMGAAFQKQLDDYRNAVKKFNQTNRQLPSEDTDKSNTSSAE